MMTVRERIEAFWSGHRPDQVPLTMYAWMVDPSKDQSGLHRLCERGLGLTHHVPTTRGQWSSDVKTVRTEYDEGGMHWVRETTQTPVGEVYALTANGWRQKGLLSTPQDFRVMTHLVEHGSIEPDYGPFDALAATMGDHEVARVSVPRSPMQTILVDWSGLEQFALSVYDCADEMEELYHALLKAWRRHIQIAADGPGKFVLALENFTAETMGPQRFARYHLPAYQELFGVLHQAGKIVGTHYDGKLSSCKDLIAQAPMDVIESLTPPPEGDMTLAQCRAAWPTKRFWSNINIGKYQLPPAKLRQAVLQGVADGAVNGSLFAYEISEDLPANWETTIPVVLDALNETRG